MNLECACCGGEAPSKRQWWNRDHGYGVCPRCFAEAVQKEGQELAEAHYGKAGVHHTIPEQKETV